MFATVLRFSGALLSSLTSHCSLGSPAMTPMAQLVGIESTPARAGTRADQRALLATRQAANAGAAECRPGDRQLVAMPLPETAAVTVKMPDRLRRANRASRENERQSH